MSAAAFHNGVKAALLGDAVFSAAIAALLGRPVTAAHGANVPLASLPADRLPCFVIEQGDGDAASISVDGGDEGLVIGLAQQQFASELHVTLVWSEQDRETAGMQRRSLPGLLAQLMLRMPQPGGIHFARLAGWEPDRGVNHPLQVWRATLRGEYVISQ